MSAIPTSIAAADPLAEAVEQLVAARRDEEIANKRRVAAEERILALHPAREEGSDTFEAAGFKVTVAGKLIYGCDDMDALIHACSQWPAHMQPIKTVVQIDTTGCKFLRANEPEVWRSIAPFVTVKPAKTSIRVQV